MNQALSMRRSVVVALALWLGIFAFTSSCRAQTFGVDFSQSAGPPLIKTKFGVYQTPLVTLPRLLDSISRLQEINVHDLRYEMGWGKPESLAFTQIGGSPTQPRFDFSTIDAVIGRLNAAGVKPLFAMSYCPTPLKSRADWPGWKDVPTSLDSWQTINQSYAARLKLDGALAPAYEMWNEPDMPEPGGKMFFSGSPQDYANLYHFGSAGIRRGDENALVGGPAAAWNLAYLTPILSQPIDFASVHAYDNYASQIAAMRGVLANRPDLPIFLTEYASFNNLPPNGPQSRFQGAMRFFRDAKGLLNDTDVTKVYWAQWLDAGEAPGMGLVTWDGHRKALFNAFKVYGMMPVDRNAVTPDGADGVDLMASSDERSAGVVLWNTSSTDHNVQVKLNHLPFSHGSLQLFRIDSKNASYVDNPASENLVPLQTIPLRRLASWQGVVPAESVVYLKISAPTPPKARAQLPPGTLMRNYGWYPHRGDDNGNGAYADFDDHTWTARVGLGDDGEAVTQTGVLLDDVAPRIRVQVRQSGPLIRQNHNSVFGIRLDFPTQSGGYNHSVLLHNGLYDAGRDASLPWGTGKAPDVAKFQAALNTGRPFDLQLAQLAPKAWDGHRVLVSVQMQATGRGSRAIVKLWRP